MLKLSTAALIGGLLISSHTLAENQFPSYLNGKFCQDTAADFMTTSINSLQRYRHNQLPTLHRGGMNNIRKYILQRTEWLRECDDYLQATTKLRVFKDDKTTEAIFDAMNAVTEELHALIKGVTYASTDGDQSAQAAAKFDRLFDTVETHKNLMLLKGQLVVR